MRGNHLVREMRKRAGLTQRVLAERVGTTQSAIARLERGVGDPTLARLSAIAEACGLELQVRLVDADGHDWSLVERRLGDSVDDRVQGLRNAVAFAVDGRAGVTAAPSARPR